MTETFCVVFQMGKVASTALTSALDTLPNVSAVQSHFLGSDALTRVLNMTIEPMNSDYFFHHQLGQLTKNIEYTRQVNRIRKGQDPRRLAVLSLTREPYAWFKSSVIQDIDGHADLLEELAPPGASTTRDGRIGAGLTRFLGMAADRISEKPTVDAYRLGLRARAPGAWDSIADWPYLQRQLLLVSMLPTDWFGLHFPSGLNLQLQDMKPKGQTWQHEEDNARMAIIRYEDIETAFPEFCTWAVGSRPKLRVENRSEEKPLAAVISEAFESDNGLRLREVLKRSAYCEHFGYATPAKPRSEDKIIDRKARRDIGDCHAVSPA